MFILNLRNRYFFLLDASLLMLVPLAALFLRVEGEAFSGLYRLPLALFTFLALLIKLPVFFAFGLYHRYWRYASIDELFTIILAVGVTTLALTVVFWGVQYAGLMPGQGLPRSVPLVDGLLTLLVVGGTRFSVRAFESAQRLRARNGPQVPSDGPRKRVLVVGAGDSGALMVREMRNSKHINFEPVCFVDDDPRKQDVVIHGVPVLGTRKRIPDLVVAHDIHEVVIAMPTAPGKVIREIVLLCEAVRVPFKTVPGIYEILSGDVSVNHLRKVEIEDLLRREPVRIDTDEVERVLAGKRVLITGAGGSIGSELARQIARSGPAHLTLLGHGENSLFTIENEMRRRFPRLNLDVVVADIRDLSRMTSIFERLRPEVVFHAAAHKHVPLMEANCEDAVTNNVGGTRNLVRLVERYGLERLVLVSSDKAVNSVNVMGATKRVAELIVQDAARRTGRPYVAVRFGNVLGSRGSVVPLLREQISRGGPVTITDPEMRRYFMTIPEAVQLVLQAGAFDLREGEIYVLDMGEPIKIVDLAKDLIELSGLELGRHIEIVYTGLRPGEKLFEELFAGGEDYRRTHHEKIFAVRNMQEPGLLETPEALQISVNQLLEAAEAGRPQDIRRLLRELVPSYTPSDLGPDGHDGTQPDPLAATVLVAPTETQKKA